MSAPSRGSLLIIFLVVFIDLLGFGIVLPLLARYGEHFQASGATLGLLMASFSAMQFLFAPLWGRVSDRVGRRPILLLGLAASALFYALFGYVTARQPDELILGLKPLTWLFIARIGAGIAGATIPTAQAYIADSTEAKNRGKGMALIGAAFGLGFTFGPLLALAFASNTENAAPSPAAGYLAAGLSALAFLAAVVKLPESLKPGDSSGAGHRKWLQLASLKRSLQNPVHRATLLAIFISTCSFAQLESTLSLVTERLGLTERENFYVFAYLGFMLLFFQGAIVRRLLPRLGEKTMAVGGGILLAAGLAAIGLSAGAAEGAVTEVEGRDALWRLFLVLPISVAGFSALNPSLQSLLSLNTSSEEQGEVLGVGQSLSSLARIIGPLVGIPMLKQSGVQAPYWLATVLMLIAAGFVARLRQQAKEGRE
ncbi:Tetracycline resistance protein, class B [Caulifigura coniformis]|uniref:Tetracycline resistance protein, class B n=1 Tax=Caulifigura coniformis TaxID=2527983 RepID=A0A517S9X0_9PLAN|nr:MFS transporter [Caulifigura coniformis]QDT52924.1 Tetracycline resistance protein, class B [Caulifigura coniformis]